MRALVGGRRSAWWLSLGWRPAAANNRRLLSDYEREPTASRLWVAPSKPANYCGTDPTDWGLLLRSVWAIPMTVSMTILMIVSMTVSVTVSIWSMGPVSG